MSKDITSFRDENYFLSNMYPCKIAYNGLTYLNAEAAFQASKVLDDAMKKDFTLVSGYNAKRLGRIVKLRSDWEDVKVEIMKEILEIKFQNPDLKKKLLNTGDSYITEGNMWNDTFWGADVHTGKGENVLGNLLMEIRSKIQKENLKGTRL